MKKLFALSLLLSSAAFAQSAGRIGTTHAATITNSSAQLVAGANRTLIAIDNESTTATIACNFGGTAAINTAGSWTLTPGQTRTWKTDPIPGDAINCISSAATSPATYEVN